MKGPYRSVLEALPSGVGAPVALADSEGVPLAFFRGQITPLQILGATDYLEFGDPPVARLVGDFHSLPPQFIDLVRSLVLSVEDQDRETEELSYHALERYRELSLLYDFSDKASSATVLDDVLSVTLRKAVDVVRAAGASILSFDEEEAGQRVLARVGTLPDIDKNIISRVASVGTPLVGDNPSSLRPIDDDNWEGLLACLPMRSANHILGVLVVQANPKRNLRIEDQRLLMALASLAATRISQAKLAEASTRRRELAAVGQLASAIVHDFKNPLTAVRGFAEMIQMSAIPAEEHASLAEQIVDNADRMWAMVDEVLHFVRGNRASLNLRKTNGQELSRLIVASVRHAASERIRIKVELEDLGEFVADVNKLERAIINLVRNASEAIVGGGHIDVFSAPANSDEICIIVEDDGPGIPQALSSTLFDPFVTSGKSGGTGLGLAIVKKIIEEHTGSIQVQSEIGRGARFVLRIPRSPSVSQGQDT
jgi:signal transduction histidine kinase